MTDPNQVAASAAIDAGLQGRPVSVNQLSATLKAMLVVSGIFGSTGIGALGTLVASHTTQLASLSTQVANIGAANTNASALTAGTLALARLPGPAPVPTNNVTIGTSATALPNPPTGFVSRKFTNPGPLAIYLGDCTVTTSGATAGAPVPPGYTADITLYPSTLCGVAAASQGAAVSQF